ncbi:hypothetical protein B0H14DRAFT_2591754 [Mycena olivaceomarginata]|nr:hypothetical protein B0H14DRAFT_2591754 [Mycena olivaceomarginata]
MPRSDASRWLDQVKKTGKIIRPANLLNWVVTACYITRQRHHFPLIAPRTGSYKEEKVRESTMEEEEIIWDHYDADDADFGEYDCDAAFSGWPKSNRGSRKKDKSRLRIHRLILVTGFPSAHHDPVGAHHHYLPFIFQLHSQYCPIRTNWPALNEKN